MLAVDQELRPAPHNVELARRVARTIHRQGYGELRSIRCEVGEGQVTLHGSVPSYYLKQAAQVAAARVPGVDRVHNQVEVVKHPTAA